MCPNLTLNVFERLRSAGIRSIVDFFKQDLDELVAASGVTYRDLVVIRRTLLAGHSAPIVGGLSSFNTVVASASIISTGCEALDSLLDGGLLTGEIIELLVPSAGPLSPERFRTAVDLGLRIAAEVATVGQKTVVWFDAASRFDAARLADFVRSLSCKNNSLLSLSSSSSSATHSSHQMGPLRNVRVVRVFDMFDVASELSSLSDGLAARLDGFLASTKLVVFDGVVESILQPTLGGAIPWDDCRGFVDQITSQLRLIAVEFSVAVLVLGYSLAARHHHFRSKDTADLVRGAWSFVSGTQIDVRCEHELAQLSTSRGPLSDVRKFTVIKSGRLKTGLSSRINLIEFLQP